MTYNELALMFLFIILMTAIFVIMFYLFLSYIREVIHPVHLTLDAAIEAIEHERVQTKEIYEALLTLNATLAQVLVASRRHPSQTVKLPTLLPEPTKES